MENDGIDTKKIIKTVNNLVSANKALNFYKNKAINKHVTFISFLYFDINLYNPTPDRSADIIATFEFFFISFKFFTTFP